MEYINNLTDNYPKIDKPIELDIVIEGGLFNGMYTAGTLLLIKKLEKKNYLRVNRISGVSIGSVLGYYYIADILDEFPDDFLQIRKKFKDQLNLLEVENKKLLNLKLILKSVKLKSRDSHFFTLENDLINSKYK